MPFLEGHTPASCLNSYIPYSNKILRHKTHCMCVCPSCPRIISLGHWCYGPHTKAAQGAFTVGGVLFAIVGTTHSIYCTKTCCAQFLLHGPRFMWAPTTYKREARRKIISVFFRQVAHFSEDAVRARTCSAAMQTSFWPNFRVRLHRTGRQRKFRKIIRENRTYIHELKLYKKSSNLCHKLQSSALYKAEGKIDAEDNLRSLNFFAWKKWLF